MVYDLYGSKPEYEAHLRTLEEARKSSQTLSNHFLLGYQYLVLGHQERGTKELRLALKEQPDDPLISQLVDILAKTNPKTP
jgi:Tfp pilus assembly protein PilF